MSKPAAFILATNGDTGQDDLITKRKELSKRLSVALDNRRSLLKKGIADGSISPKDSYDLRPTLADISESHILYVRSQYKPNVSVAFEYIKSTPNGNLSMSAGSTIKFDLANCTGSFIHDQVIHIKLAAIGAADPVDPETGDYNRNAPRYKYTNFPGIRICEKTRLKFGQEVIDEYTDRDTLFQLLFRTKTDKLRSYYNIIGQQTTKDGNYYYPDQRVNQVLLFTNGPQTAKPLQESLDLWIPLAFWYNLMVEASIMSTGIVTLDQSIEVDFAPLNKIIQMVLPNNTVTNIGTNLKVEKLELYTRNIYLDPEIDDLMKNRSSLSIMRVHKHLKQTLNKAVGSVPLQSNFKFPMEYLMVGVQPTVNDTQFDTWNIYADQIPVEVPVPALLIDPATWPIMQLVSRHATFYDQVQCLTDLKLITNTTEIFKGVPAEMFNKYVPWKFDTLSLYNPTAYFIPFSLFTDQFHPSGYIQFTKLRELYLNYTSDLISQSNKCDMYVSGIALNFLYISKEGNAMMKFAT